MAGQSLNATFFAFRKRDKSGVLTGLSIAYVVIAVALLAAFWFLNKQAMADYVTWITSFSQVAAESGKGGDAVSPAMMMPPASVMSLGGSYTLFMLLYYILFASYEAGCLRWLVRGETGGFMGLSLGADTWRVYFGYWVWFFLLLAIYIVCLVLMIGLGVAFGVAATDQASAAAPIAALFPLLALLLLLPILYVVVRFSPAAATSIARKRFAFFDAWKVSSGRFWALFGAFFLLWLIYLIVIIVLSGGLGVAIVMGAGSHIAASGASEPQSPEQVFAMLAAPQILIPVVVGYGIMIACGLVFMLGLFGINARAAQAAIEDGKIAVAT